MTVSGTTLSPHTTELPIQRNSISTAYSKARRPSAAVLMWIRPAMTSRSGIRRQARRIRPSGIAAAWTSSWCSTMPGAQMRSKRNLAAVRFPPPSCAGRLTATIRLWTLPAITRWRRSGPTRRRPMSRLNRATTSVARRLGSPRRAAASGAMTSRKASFPPARRI